MTPCDVGADTAIFVNTAKTQMGSLYNLPLPGEKHTFHPLDKSLSKTSSLK